MKYEDGLSLGEIIERLKNEPADNRLAIGFCLGLSYRGYYECLAFKPAMNVTVELMLIEAQRCVGRTFDGYKGGEYEMTLDTECYLADWGECGPPITYKLLDLLLSVRV